MVGQISGVLYNCSARDIAQQPLPCPQQPVIPTHKFESQGPTEPKLELFGGETKIYQHCQGLFFFKKNFKIFFFFYLFYDFAHVFIDEPSLLNEKTAVKASKATQPSNHTFRETQSAREVNVCDRKNVQQQLVSMNKPTSSSI